MMKKITAFLALSVFVTGAAFAQFALSGQVIGRADFAANFGGLGGGAALNDTPADQAGVMFVPEDQLRRRFTQGARLFVTAQDLDQTFGGTFRMWFPTMQGGSRTEWQQDQPYGLAGSSHFHGFVWWSPTPGLRITMGEDPWGRYGLGHIIGGGFNNGSGDAMLGWGAAGEAHYGTSFRRGGIGGGGWDDRMGRMTGFFPGFGAMGLSAQFTPLALRALTVVAAVPFMLGNSPFNEAWMHDDIGWIAGMLRSTLGVRYAIEGVGTVAFTVVGGPGYWGNRTGLGPSEPTWTGSVFDARMNGGGNGGNRTNSSKFYLSFFSPFLVDNMQFHVGLAYTLPFSIPTDTTTNTAQAGWTHHFPMEFGLGVQYADGPFSVRLRVAQMFLGFIDRPSDHAAGRSEASPITGAGLHLSYNLGFIRVSLNAGTQIVWDHFNVTTATWTPERGGTTNYGTSGTDAAIGWYVTPYISMPLANAAFFAGFHVETNGVRRTRGVGTTRPIDNAPDIAWRIPVAFRVEF